MPEPTAPPKGKCTGNDGYNGVPQIGTVHADDDKTTGNVEDGHDGDQLLAHFGNLLQAADDNNSDQHGNHNADEPRGDFGGTGNQTRRGKSTRQRIRLNRSANAEGGNCGEQSKQHSKELAQPLALEATF